MATNDTIVELIEDRMVDPSEDVEALVFNVRDCLSFFEGTTLNAEGRTNASGRYLGSHIENVDDALDELGKLNLALQKYRILLRDEQVTRAVTARLAHAQRAH